MKKKFIFNITASLLYQFVIVVCGFILPRLYLQAFGSEVNGLVSSITQFLGLISFCEMGVGAVIQSSLYKPLAEKNDDDISAVVSSGTRFFQKIGYILFIYVILLVFLFPFAVKNQFSGVFTATLIIAISIGTFAQYFFGIMDNIILAADQKGYIQYLSQIIAVVANTLMSIVVVKLGGNIQIVKLLSSFIFILRPLYLRYYIRRHYSINRKYKYKGEPIKQKWNGLSQHIASVVLGDTDTIVLTLFSTLSAVSIYSVYYLAINGVKTLILSLSYGIQPVLGNVYAKDDRISLKEIFTTYEYLFHNIVFYFFTCTSVLLVPFVTVYTNNINDANYSQPLFAFIITFAYAIMCIRTPYSNLIFAAGHYKQTQRSFIIAAIINVIISIVCVKNYGLVGVAIGTMVAMLYQTIWMTIYCLKTFNLESKMEVIKLWCVDLLMILFTVFCTKWIKLADVSYISWVLMAIKVCIVALGVTVCVNFILYRKMIIQAVTLLKKKKKRQV